MKNGTFWAIGSTVALAIAGALWFFPSVVFPDPGINDAMVLSDMTLPVAGAAILADVVLVLVGSRRGWSSVAPIALGVFLLGVVLAFVVGSNTFANMSEDRFGPLFELPGPFLLAAALILVLGLRHKIEGAAHTGLVIGGAGSALLVVWMVLRGPREWLVAPYGFDILLLIVLGSFATYVVGAVWQVPQRDQLQAHPHGGWFEA